MVAGSSEGAIGRRTQFVRCLALVVGALSLLVACDGHFDAGATQEEQLCRALGRSEPDGSRASLRVGPLLDQVSSTGEVPVSLVEVHLIVGPHRSNFDLLGEYAPFINFADAVGSLYDRNLTTSIVPTRAVVASAEKVDEALAKGICD